MKTPACIQQPQNLQVTVSRTPVAAGRAGGWVAKERNQASSLRSEPALHRPRVTFSHLRDGQSQRLQGGLASEATAHSTVLPRRGNPACVQRPAGPGAAPEASHAPSGGQSGWATCSHCASSLSTSLLRSQELAKHRAAAWWPVPSSPPCSTWAGGFQGLCASLQASRLASPGALGQVPTTWPLHLPLARVDRGLSVPHVHLDPCLVASE